MSIEDSQAILKYFIDLKSSVWFTLGSEEETMFCDTCKIFQLDCRLRFSKYLMAGSPVFSINFTNRLIPAKPNYLMSIEDSQAILKYFIDLKSSVWFTLGSEEETMFCDTCKIFQLDCRSRFSKY